MYRVTSVIPTNAIIIHRLSRPWKEKVVRITQNNNGWHLDPQELLYRKLGLSFSRTGCIESFAEGIASVHSEVYIHKGPHWGDSGTRRHHKPAEVYYIWYLMGRAFMLNKLDDIFQTMMRFPAFKWQSILNETGEYYINNPWERGITLRINI